MLFSTGQGRNHRIRSSCGASITGSRLGGLAGWDHRWVIISVVYLLVRCLLGCLTVLSRAQASKDAELLCHSNNRLND
jgi:hypothetical protein